MKFKGIIGVHLGIVGPSLEIVVALNSKTSSLFFFAVDKTVWPDLV